MRSTENHKRTIQTVSFSSVVNFSSQVSIIFGCFYVVQTHWSKAFDETGKQLKDFGSDVKDETTKFFDDVADAPKSYWDATVQAFDNTGKKLKEFGSDVKDGSTKFFDDITRNGANSVTFNFFPLLALVAAAFAFN